MVAGQNPAKGEQQQPGMDPEAYKQPPFNIPQAPNHRAQAEHDKEQGHLDVPREENDMGAQQEGQEDSSDPYTKTHRRRHSSLAGLTRKDRPEPPGGMKELTEDDCYDRLAYGWPRRKKWAFLGVIAAIQVSMNFNTSVFPSAVAPLSEHFGISEQAARVGQCVYLVLYSFGCELWAPWSEEFGRWPVLQLSMFLINIWQLPCAFAPNFGTIVVCRALGGLSTAGGSVTLGLIADLYEPDDQQWPLAFIVLSSCIGTSIGGVIGGPIQKYLSWHWFFYIQLIFGAAVQLVHFFTPECRSTILIDKEAKRRRKAAPGLEIYGPNELKAPRISLREAVRIWARPFEMFAREPIVLFLSLLSGFSDALIFIFLEGFAAVYKAWDFSALEAAWAVIPINVAYLVAYAAYLPWIHHYTRTRHKKGDDFAAERRMKILLFLAPLEPAGLIGFAWTSLGPAYGVHWAAPMVFSLLIGVANYAIYFSTVDYMIAAYGPYSASACGGNAFARDLLAGISAMFAVPMYEGIGSEFPTEWASTILAVLSCLVVVPVYVFYWKGPVIRRKSKFAQALAEDREAHGGRRVSQAGNLPYGEDPLA
ncbi:hypothetical protein KVR01_011694 [Diaporthe batatas]|uniref:uncharacterized protein n=1 Tax=Diaporthe batatas TaxID=748121 RepID=UPI001D04D4E9|nr:uncharacterized protein KVR01_011694 [Diaporthe batatas]KAG8158572.1 hypothetical protein KVR01_011694 [Diaporthe batatas]